MKMLSDEKLVKLLEEAYKLGSNHSLQLEREFTLPSSRRALINSHREEFTAHIEQALNEASRV